MMQYLLLFLCLCGNICHCFQSFSGTNLYYAAGLYSSDQEKYFSALSEAGIKVLRVWLDSQTSSSTKGTNIISFPDLEPNEIGVFNDTVLYLIDDLMLISHKYNIKLLISMHSFNALEGGDVYGQVYGTGYFYQEDSAFEQFDNRLEHILTHKHSSLNTEWRYLNDYIFGFESENEAMIGNGQEYIETHTYWQCDRAKFIKSILGDNSKILVMTGGESWLDESMQNDWFNCDYLDVLSIHAYGTGDYNNVTKLEYYVNKAINSNKKLLFQEWGACYWDTSNNNCPQGTPLSENTRDDNIINWSNDILSSGIPWLYWQIIPNKDPNYSYDYEIGIYQESWNTFVNVSKNSQNYYTPFDYSSYLL